MKWQHKTIHMTEDAMQDLAEIRSRLDSDKSDSNIIRFALRFTRFTLREEGADVPDSKLE